MQKGKGWLLESQATRFPAFLAFLARSERAYMPSQERTLASECITADELVISPLVASCLINRKGNADRTG